MFKRKNKQIGLMLTVLIIVFTTGLILGTVALFYIPEDIISEARGAFSPILDTNADFTAMFKENFVMEIVWILAIWILGSTNLTSSLTGAIMSVRGFVIGFSVAFVLTGGTDWVRFVICCILPQCMTALPVMTVFTIQCISYALERKYKDNVSARYFACGALFVGITAVATVAETWFMVLFRSSL